MCLLVCKWAQGRLDAPGVSEIVLILAQWRSYRNGTCNTKPWTSSNYITIVCMRHTKTLAQVTHLRLIGLQAVAHGQASCCEYRPEHYHILHQQWVAVALHAACWARRGARWADFGAAVLLHRAQPHTIERIYTRTTRHKVPWALSA